jgi:hypothetical protein
VAAPKGYEQENHLVWKKDVKLMQLLNQLIDIPSLLS